MAEWQQAVADGRQEEHQHQDTDTAGHVQLLQNITDDITDNGWLPS